MTDIHSEDDVAAQGAASRLDRRSFLRALSGGAFTLVAGGLTVTLAACQGASNSSPVLFSSNSPFSPVGPQGTPIPISSASFNPPASSGSSGSGTSGRSSSSNTGIPSPPGGSSNSSSSNSSSSSGSRVAQRGAAPDGLGQWSTRV